MYVRFTPKQLAVLKKLLPTVKMNAYDIQIYQEILLALDNPINDVPTNKKEQKFIPPKKIKVNPVSEPSTQKQVENTKKKKDYVNSIKADDLVNPINTSTKDEELEELEDISIEQQESIFSVIDSRTKKSEE